jgi:signal transduction histidine kinase
MINDSGLAEDGFGSLNISETLETGMAVGLAMANDQRKIVNFSPEAEKILQLRAAMVLNQSMQVLPSPLPQIIEETLLTGKNVSNRQIVVCSESLPEGKSLRVFAALVSVGRSGPSGVILYFNDISGVSMIERNIRRLDRLAGLGSFSSSMAHEIKNALQPVNTFLETLVHRIRDSNLMSDPEDVKLMDLVGREMKRINSIVSQMLRFARSRKPSFSATHLHEVLERSISLIQYEIERKELSLRCRFQAENDLVIADAYQLEQAFLNLLFNALEAMGPGGIITLSSILVPPVSEGNYPLRIRIEVSDSGTGIPPENMDRLFETFFTTKKNGTGLGLTITRRIIEEHKGQIEVKSHLTQGTVISVYIPIQPGCSVASP